MLTKDDLLAIGELIDQKIEPLKEGQKHLEQGQKRLERQIKKVESAIILYFDNRDVEQNKRLQRIEAELGLSNN